MRRPGVYSAFQLIPKVFSWVEVRFLCRSLELFYINIGKPCAYGAQFCAQGHCHEGNCNTTEYKGIPYNCVLSTSCQPFGEDPHTGVIVRCPNTFGHTVYIDEFD